MFSILKKQKVAENTYLMEIEAPDIAKKTKPGHFVILRIDKEGERIPLTIADYNRKTITIVFLVVGHTTEKLSNLRKGDSILDVTGPLGNPSLIKEYGTVCLVGGGLGIAPIYPITKALKKANNIITIIGAKSKNHLFWEDQFKKISDKMLVATDDGSRGFKGVVSEVLKKVMEKDKPNLVIAIGPPIMMKAVSAMTRQRIRTKVSLNPLMMDGLGMCGCCRVVVEGKTRFACVDGPEFNGHKVDWNELINRNKFYEEEEHKCKIGK